MDSSWVYPRKLTSYLTFASDLAHNITATERKFNTYINETRRASVALQNIPKYILYVYHINARLVCIHGLSIMQDCRKESNAHLLSVSGTRYPTI